MDSENSETNESSEFIYQVTEKLNLKSPNNKNIGLVNLSIYYTWTNIKSAYNNNRSKSLAPIWNNEFNLPDGSYSISDIQDYLQYVIKKHQTIADTPPVQIYVNKIKNRIVLKQKLAKN